MNESDHAEYRRLINELDEKRLSGKREYRSLTITNISHIREFLNGLTNLAVLLLGTSVALLQFSSLVINEKILIAGNAILIAEVIFYSISLGCILDKENNNIDSQSDIYSQGSNESIDYFLKKYQNNIAISDAISDFNKDILPKIKQREDEARTKRVSSAIIIFPTVFLFVIGLILIIMSLFNFGCNAYLQYLIFPIILLIVYRIFIYRVPSQDPILEVKRGDSWAYFPLAYSILLSICIAIISLCEYQSCFLSFDWQFKIYAIVCIASLLFYICFFDSGFRNEIVGLFERSKNAKERL